MPIYTIQQDKPWISTRVSEAPSATSIYSDDYNQDMPDQPPAVPPHGDANSYHPSYHAHPRQQINDYGPQVRQSKLPIFKQVRSMLHKPPPITTPANPKWDEYTGELSESGKAPKVKPSTYTSPWEGAFRANRKRSPERPNKLRKSRNQSPVSVLRDEELTPVEPIAHDMFQQQEQWSPVSPLQDDELEAEPSLVPEPLSPNVQRTVQPVQETPPSSRHIMRKPAPRSSSTVENEPPVSPHHSPSQSSDVDTAGIESGADSHPNSHFSWTTYAPSVAPGRASTDTMANRQTRQFHSATNNPQPGSHFSWSTIGTHVPTSKVHPAMRNESPPPSPPPAVPSKFTSPPVQSILSRRRPIQRVEKEEWTPPPPKSKISGSSTPRSGTATPKTATPTSANTVRPLPLPKDAKNSKSRSPSSATKALPPPPGQPTNLSHLEQLLAQDRSIQLQRKNVEKGIMELEKIERASPLDVPFATVKDAKKKLLEYRTRLAEVKLEEREVGIAIARARRKEEKEYGGDGETLWVRRVTG